MGIVADSMMGCITITTLCILVNTVLGGNIVEELTNAGATSLVEYVSAAGLAELLSGPGPYTVFAPDNSAFANLAPDTLQALAEDGDLLKNVLSYHVVSGNIASKDISNDLTVDTLEGTAIRANVYLQSKFYDGFVTVNGKRVKKADIQADNGMIHLMSSVMYPLPTSNIAEIASDDLNALLADKEALARVLLRHVVPGAVFFNGMTWDILETAGGLEEDMIATQRFRGGVVKVVSSVNATRIGATAVEADIIATNGVIHAIDTVI